VGEASCPKCGTARDDARTHCASCGLAHDRMGAFAQARDAVPDALGEAWQRAVAAWDDRARHDELLRLVTQHDAYAWAAARYRERLKERADDAVAQQELQRVRKAAEAQLLSTGTNRRVNIPKPYRRTLAMLGLLVFMILALAIYALATRGRSDAPREHAPPGATK
jgi:hypothetical protein